MHKRKSCTQNLCEVRMKSVEIVQALCFIIFLAMAATIVVGAMSMAICH